MTVDEMLGWVKAKVKKNPALRNAAIAVLLGVAIQVVTSYLTDSQTPQFVVAALTFVVLPALQGIATRARVTPVLMNDKRKWISGALKAYDTEEKKHRAPRKKVNRKKAIPE